MTEDQIERKVEHFIDHLDWVFTHQAMSQDQYDKNMLAIHKWAEAKYAEAERFARHFVHDLEDR